MWNVWVSLWEEKPIIIKEKDTTAGALENAEIKKVKLCEDGLPKLDTQLLGKMKIKTDEWILNSNLKPD